MDFEHKYGVPVLPQHEYEQLLREVQAEDGTSRVGWWSRRRVVVACAIAGVALLGACALFRHGDEWNVTTVFRAEDIQRIWEWEVESGHHPSQSDSAPGGLKLDKVVDNPSLPPSTGVTWWFGRPSTKGAGPDRHALEISNPSEGLGFPLRPPVGAIANLDVIRAQCDYSNKKLVRDCLAFLGYGGGLGHGTLIRRNHKHSKGKYLYTEKHHTPTGTDKYMFTHHHHTPTGTDKYVYTEVYPTPTGTDKYVYTEVYPTPTGTDKYVYTEVYPTPTGTEKFTLPPKETSHLQHLQHYDRRTSKGSWIPMIRSERDSDVSRDDPTIDWEPPLVDLPAPTKRPVSSYTMADFCRDHPRIFHMYWTGPFTDKPYMALMSFLYTQRTALHDYADPTGMACRPQLWMWVNPGSATDVQSSEEEMMRVLQENEWSSPFLDPRFAPVIHFKLWNTAERLDSIPELAKDWRDMPSLFNSGGDVLNAKVSTPQTKGDQDDKHSVTLSDVVRFVVTHEFGGIYLDADMLLLRDWEELWGWKGAFAYRWSVHDKYNTAVLKLNKNSALGRFILRTALKNGFDFHPMSVSAYLRNAGLDRLMFQVPDALFDPAWLNAENKQRDQPPMPAFDSFSEFFEENDAVEMGGFNNFFRGAYSYHVHNQWGKPVDPKLNKPHLGSRFRRRDTEEEEEIELDDTGLSWSAALKRTFEAYVRGESSNMYGEWLSL